MNVYDDVCIFLKPMLLDDRIEIHKMQGWTKPQLTAVSTSKTAVYQTTAVPLSECLCSISDLTIIFGTILVRNYIARINFSYRIPHVIF